MAQKNSEYRAPLSGPQFEVLVAQQKYEELSEKRCIIEPNLLFYGNIAPSTIDFLAEFDLFIFRSDNSSHIIELKARPVSEYDIYKFEIQTKRSGLIKSNLEYVTTNSKRNLVKNLASNL